METKLRPIWPDISSICKTDDDKLHETYLRCIESLARSALQKDPRAFATKNLDDTLAFIDIIRGLVKINGPYHGKKVEDLARREIFVGVAEELRRRRRQANNDQIVNSLCLAVSLWLSLEIRGPEKQEGDCLVWSNDSTLAEVFSTAFPRQSDPVPSQAFYTLPVRRIVRSQSDPTTLPASLPLHVHGAHPDQSIALAQRAPSALIDVRLTIEYLRKYHGCKVLWVDNLAEHLEIDWIGPYNSELLIRIYRHKIFLWNELRLPENSPLPRELVEEVIETLNLLLPYGDRRTAIFLRRYGMSENLYGLGWCGRQRQRDLHCFQYFRESLSELSEIIKEGPPGYKQLLPDRDGRNIMDFLNFWIALFVAGFTVLSIAFGVSAIVLAVWQYNVAVDQYELALAQACATPDSVSQLPRFCSSPTGTWS